MAAPAQTHSEVGRLYDDLLVTLVQSGDRAAGERLARRWQPRLARAARRMLRDDELALVAVQEAWISILRGIAGLRDPSSFAPWAFGILRRRCVDRIRVVEKRRGEEAGMDAEPAFATAPDTAVALDQAFADLSPDHRLAAQLHFVEGFTLAEIAAVQDVPLGTAKTRLFHARRQLKAALSGDDT